MSRSLFLFLREMEFAFFMVSDFVRYDQVIFEMARVTPFLSKPATKDRMTTAEISLNWPRISRKNGVLH
ncbi:hypothetical protein [Acetobacter sp. UBA5411]|uniref:hypothetical protein n=1 Tax=Acetobacter sp. UBA5411 TaxID=1945905 RepID=UPI0025C217AF|nr:hypothetical protein [Acetobacter sp. UBA5411]